MRKASGKKEDLYMKQDESISLLISEINKSISIINQIEIFYRDFLRKEVSALGKTKVTAMVMAQIMENYYTSVETLFVRISQFFENNLSNEKWHKDLLDKMILQIEGVRDRVISDKSYRELLELMRFRHFKRYYFELDYDWDKLDYLSKKLEAQFSGLPKELIKFISFLKNLQ